MMAFFNYATMQMAAKIVYYGPGLCGKTTNLQYIYNKTSPKSRGEMVSLETESDRTLFFDLLPLEVGVIAGFRTRFQLYTVPGQVFYGETRRMVLKGVDGVVFVADSQRPMRDANVESLKDLDKNLKDMGINIKDIPIVLQYNKRDMPDVFSVEEMNKAMNPKGWPTFEAVAVTGEGVFPTLKALSSLVLENLNKEYGVGNEDAAARAPEPPAPEPRPAPKPEPAKPKPEPAKPAPKPAPKPEPAKPAPRPAPLTPSKPPPKPGMGGKPGLPTPAGGTKTPKAPLPQKQSSKTLVWVIVLILIMAGLAVAAVLFLGGQK
jgi:hypothetical protein